MFVLGAVSSANTLLALSEASAVYYVTVQLYDHLSHNEITSKNLTTSGITLGSLIRRCQTAGPYYGNSGFSTYYDDDYEQASY